MLANVFVLANFHFSVRLVDGAPKILLKKRIDSQDCVFLALRHNHIANDEGAHIPAVFKISGIDGLGADFVKNFATFSPCGKNSGGFGRRDGNPT
jgi:hypothetical protein